MRDTTTCKSNARKTRDESIALARAGGGHLCYALLRTNAVQLKILRTPATLLRWLFLMARTATLLGHESITLFLPK